MNALTNAIFKKDNATKHFNAGAIIATPKRQLFAQKHAMRRKDR